MMNAEIPSAEHVRSVLCRLSYSDMTELARQSGVPFTTLWKVRSGETPNPRLETVRQFAPHVGSIMERAKAGAPKE